MSVRQRFSRIGPGLKRMAVGVVAFLITGFVISFFVGAPFLAGFLGGIDTGLAWLFLVAVVVYLGYYSDDIGVGFVFVSLAILALLTLVLPMWATAPFRPVSAFLFDRTITVNPVYFAVLSVSGVIAYWALNTWLFGRGKRPAAVANRVRTNSESLARQYAKIAATIAGFLVTSVFIFASQGGDFLGEVFTLLADAPVVSGYVATFLGYVGAFFTSLPVIGAFGTTEYLLVIVVIGVLAFGAKYSSALD